MKRFLFFLLILAGGAYYVNQASLIPSWPPYPLPEWVPAWARIQPQGATPGDARGAGRRAGGGQGSGQGGGQGRGQGGGGGRGGPGQGGDGPVPVVVAAARYADVDVTVDAVGTVQALNTVTVRTQVDGKLIELDFKDGQDVKKGDVLARIDPATYQAQYDQMIAKKAQDEATLANARNDLIRYQKLAATEAGSKQQADTQRALVAQLEAQVAGDQAQIDNAKATLAYTTITAPIDGRTGIRLVDQGNILHASDQNGIVVITQVKPISVIFNLPQQQLRPVNTAMGKGSVRVQALEADNSTVIDTGTIQVIDNQVDQTTGTIKLKSIYPNADLQLWPGQFVNVRSFIDTLKHVVVVPTGAVQRGPNGAYVYVLAGKKAALRNVEIQRQNENDAVVKSGLTPPEEVVTSGFSRLTDGAEVRVAPAEAAPGEAAPSGERAAAAAAPTPSAADPSAGAPSPGGAPTPAAAPAAGTPPESGQRPQGGSGSQRKGGGGAAGVPGSGVPGSGGGGRRPRNGLGGPGGGPGQLGGPEQPGAQAPPQAPSQ
jgi:multidrug efflux system membrane fusion protein